MTQQATRVEAPEEQDEPTTQEQTEDFEEVHGVYLSGPELRRLYRDNQAGWQKATTRAGNPKDQPVEVQQELIDGLQLRVQAVKELGYELCQLGGCTLSGDRHPEHSLAPQGQPPRVTTRWVGEPNVLVCGVISSEHGLVHMLLKEATPTAKALKGADVVSVLKAVRAKRQKKKVALFMDNASIHRCKAVKDAAARLEIPLVYNLPYSTDLSGVGTI